MIPSSCVVHQVVHCTFRSIIHLVAFIATQQPTSDCDIGVNFTIFSCLLIFSRISNQ